MAKKKKEDINQVAKRVIDAVIKKSEETVPVTGAIQKSTKASDVKEKRR